MAQAVEHLLPNGVNARGVWIICGIEYSIAKTPGEHKLLSRQVMSLPPPIQKSLQQNESTKEAPRSVDELTQRNIETIVELENATKADRSHTERFAETVTLFCGSVGFLWAHIILFACWMCWNASPQTSHWRFDPFPFNFLGIILAGEAIFLASFILMNQRHESQLNQRRNHLDLQINLLSEQENTKMLQMLSQIAKKVGADVGSDPDIKILEAAARPEKMLQQIDETIAKIDANDNSTGQEQGEE